MPTFDKDENEMESAELQISPRASITLLGSNRRPETLEDYKKLCHEIVDYYERAIDWDFPKHSTFFNIPERPSSNQLDPIPRSNRRHHQVPPLQMDEPKSVPRRKHSKYETNYASQSRTRESRNSRKSGQSSVHSISVKCLYKNSKYEIESGRSRDEVREKLSDDGDDLAKRPSASIRKLYDISNGLMKFKDELLKMYEDYNMNFNNTKRSTSTFESFEYIPDKDSSFDRFEASIFKKAVSSVILEKEQEPQHYPSRTQPNSKSCQTHCISFEETIRYQVMHPLMRKLHEMHKRNVEDYLMLLKEVDNIPYMVAEIYKNGKQE